VREEGSSDIRLSVLIQQLARGSQVSSGSGSGRLRLLALGSWLLGPALTEKGQWQGEGAISLFLSLLSLSLWSHSLSL
jgi:hypothetical protein